MQQEFEVKKVFVLDGADSGCGGCDYGHYEFEILDYHEHFCTVTELKDAEKLCNLLNKWSLR